MERPPPAETPPPDRIRRYLRYGLSLPERALRSTAGVVGGALRESASVLLPGMVRDAKTYRVFVGQMLDFLAEDVGRVQGRPRAAAADVDNYMARKTVGNFVDLASLATLHVSPMLLLAVASDAAYGSKAYLRELARELEARGVIDEARSIDDADDLLDSIAAATEKTATAFDVPPLSIDALREAVRETRRAFADVDPSKVSKALPDVELRRAWEELQATARRQGVDPLALSGAVALRALPAIGTLGKGALSSVRAAGALLDRHVLEHYRAVLGDIDQRGFYAALADTGKPYAEAVWRNFSADNATATETFLAGLGDAPARHAWRRLKRFGARRGGSG